MADPFLGEIRAVGFNFAPAGWAYCQGQILPIQQNSALFSLLGTTYGGNGTTNFALPNLQGTFPLGWGDGPGLTPRRLGDGAGATTHTLTTAEMPAHTHTLQALNAPGNTNSPAGAMWARPRYGRAVESAYAPSTAAPNAPASVAVLGVAGANGSHENLPPYLPLNFVICLQGDWPTRP